MLFKENKDFEINLNKSHVFGAIMATAAIEMA